MKRVGRVTLLDLVQALQDSARTDEEVVAVLMHLIKTRRVVLSAAVCS